MTDLSNPDLDAEALALAAPGDEWQHDQLRGVLAEVVDEAGTTVARASSTYLFTDRD